LEASEPGSKEWKNALEQAEEGVEWLQLLEATHYSPGSEADDESALVITDEEHNALVSALAGIKPRLESTGPNTDERRQAIEDANAVIEDALYGGEDD
jgi:hypothetical protein